MTVIHHALILNLHQPDGNLAQLWAEQPEEARALLMAYDRIARFLWSYEAVARVHLSLSGSLLETLKDPDFQAAVYGTVDCGSLLWHLQNRQIIEILGTAYYHPVLPLIPCEDWPEHLGRWREIAAHLFWRQDFRGFWPPELGFSMELIPWLVRQGYRYVVVDSEHVVPITPMNEAERRFRPHKASFGGEEIIVVVRDRRLSMALFERHTAEAYMEQLQGLTQGVDHPLVTTGTDGENGAWYRNPDPQQNFWGGFYQGLLELGRSSGQLKPTFLHDYLDQYGVLGEVTVRTGAWNTEWHDGQDFGQWAGSTAQAETLERIRQVSRSLHLARLEAENREIGQQEQASMAEALSCLLRAETSCNFYWGDAWVARAARDLDQAEATLGRLRAKKYLMDTDRGWLLPEVRAS